MNRLGALAVMLALAAVPAWGAEAPSKDKFIGAWRLIDVRERDAETGAEKPATPGGAGGQLIYTANGRLSLQIARVGWDKAPAGDPANFASYFGRWELVTAEGYVLHQQDGNLNPKQVGQAAKRYYSFDAQGHLSLATPPAKNAEGRNVATVFVWERYP